MFFSTGRPIILVIFFIVIVQKGDCIRCYECTARLGPGETNACLTGDEAQLKRSHCVGPSVCAAYHYQSVIPGTPTIHHVTRGCQAMRYGVTCEDIFNELRMNNQILPGQHTCTTCSTDLCNSAIKISSMWIIITLVISSLSLILLL